MKKCPRCHQLTMKDDDVLNSLSRRDNKTYICNECGHDESYIDARMMPVGKLERDFVAALDKQGT